jgi:hypothetical protein
VFVEGSIDDLRGPVRPGQVIPPHFPPTGRFTANVPRACTLTWKEI